jgi:hypothetical protein
MANENEEREGGRRRISHAADLSAMADGIEPMVVSTDATKRLTLEAVKRELDGLGIVIRRSVGGEFRVNLRGGSESTAYYATDLQDALGTGKAMAQPCMRAQAEMRQTAEYSEGPDAGRSIPVMRVCVGSAFVDMVPYSSECPELVKLMCERVVKAINEGTV